MSSGRKAGASKNPGAAKSLPGIWPFGQIANMLFGQILGQV